MFRVHRLMRPAVIAGIVFIVGAAAAAAQERASVALLVHKIYVKTNNFGVLLNPAGVQAFTPTTVKCPLQTTCLVRVELSTELAYVQPGDSVSAAVTIDGVAAAPASAITLKGMQNGLSTPELFTSRHFTWAGEVGGGPHVVEVKGRTMWGYQYTHFVNRTLTITVLKPSA